MKRLVLALLVCAAGAAQANSACDKPKKDFDGLYCLNKVYQEADKELNDNYGKLAARLDADGKKRLKAGQLRWIEERNGSCSRRDGGAFFVNLECATSTTIQRAQFLQDRVRECASAGCQNSKL
ncbi:lysozyme inhibitor LprI family protein [uncultured Massilia sp.]|uniref:lysozyme inhibitor LprI family protein n=1 Tax=uncultured Massilia sp. TaxID=169973 RepID=UPI0025FB24FD|nr:lysozyme inhibitor LprI family protein [uncultured Massilia sp.]